MAERLVNIDRQTPMLLPPDLREWVAENDLAHLVLEAVELCDMRGAQLNVRGSGSEQYPPSMMMALLIMPIARGCLVRGGSSGPLTIVWRYVTCAPTIIPTTTP